MQNKIECLEKSFKHMHNLHFKKYFKLLLIPVEFYESKYPQIHINMFKQLNRMILR